MKEEEVLDYMKIRLFGLGLKEEVIEITAQLIYMI